MYPGLGQFDPASFDVGPGGFQYPGGFSNPLDLFGLDLPDIDLGGIRDWIGFAVDTWQRFSDQLDPNVPWSGNYDNQPLHPVCNGTPDFAAVQRAMGRIPDEEVAWITQTLRQGNDGNGPTTRGELANPATLPYWVKAIMGGRDCVNTRFPEAPPRFVELVAEHGEPSVLESGFGTVGGKGLLVAGALAALIWLWR